MLIPAIPMPVPRLEQLERLGEDAELLAGLLRFTCPFDFSGTPTVTLRNGFALAGSPITMQLAGPRLGEAALIRAGHAFQTQTDWHTRHPANPGQRTASASGWA
jgi:amidase